MTRDFLIGVLTTETASQSAAGIFFCVAFWLVQREAEYLVFSALVWSIALMTASMALGFGGVITDWRISTMISHGAAILAVALHVHFVLLIVRPRACRRLILSAYAIAGFYLLVLLSGRWWSNAALAPELARRVAGVDVEPLFGIPSLVGKTFYFVAMMEVIATLVALIRSDARRERHGIVLIVGILLAVAATMNDGFVVLGYLHSHLLVSHLFLGYTFAVALSLLFRYQLATAGLADAALTLRVRTEELRRSHADIRQMQHELVSKKQLAAVGELAAAIAHEVRNPLAIIMNAVAGLRRKSVEENDRRTLLGIVDEETARLNRLVTDLLRFARPVTIRTSAVSVPELIRRAKDKVDENHEVVVEPFEIDPLPTIRADANLLRHAFDNIVANAFQATPNGGTVRVRVTATEIDALPFLCIDVIDDGQGMDGQTLQRAVDPFFTTRPSGTGLGLPIVRRIMEAHGGRLDIESTSGKGTKVSLLLPLYEGALPVGEAEVQA